MIQFFRNFSETWVAKIIFSLLALSMISVFGITGLSDFFGKDDTAITVGEKKISVIDLDRSFRQKIASLQAMGQYITPSQAVQAGLLEVVIAEKIQHSLMEQLTEKYGLVASDTAVSNYIVNNQNFQNMSGQFDRQFFLSYLRALQISEKDFIAQLRLELASKQLSDALAGMIAPPTEVLKKMYIQENQTRDVKILSLKTEDLVLDLKITPEEKQAYYEAMSDDLWIPEEREVLILKLSVPSIMETMTVSDDEVLAYYQENIAQFTVPEKRTVKQVLLTDDQETEMNEAEFNKQAVDMGELEKTSVFEELGDAFFNAEKDKISGPVTSPLGTHYFRVEKIVPETKSELKTVRNDIIKTIKEQKGYGIIDELKNQIDDELGMGKKLSDIVAQRKLSTVNKKINISDSELPVELVQEVFVLNPEQSTLLYPFGEEVIVAQVLSITPARMKTIDEADAQIVDQWKLDQKTALMNEKANEVLTLIKGGNSAKTIKLFKQISEKDLSVTKDDPTLNSVLKESLFAANLNEWNSTLTPEGFIIYNVKDIKYPTDVTDDELKVYQKEYSAKVAQSFIKSLIAQMDLKISVNTDLIYQTFNIENE